MENVSKSTIKGWFISLTGALFFFYAFIHCNMMAPLQNCLMSEFNFSSTTIGLIAGLYFYANILFMIPAGLLLDRYSLKMIMVINMCLAIFSSFLFAIADSLWLIAFARFLAGIMMSFGLVSCIKLASLCLPQSSMALASSIIIAIGMFGGVFSQTPVNFLVQTYGWRIALGIIGSIGVVIALILFFIVNTPKVKATEKAQNIKESLKEVMLRPKNWLGGLYITLLNLPVAILGALYGVSYFMQNFGFTSAEAATVSSMLFFGMIVGSPFFGWFADFVQTYRFPMMLGAALCFVFVLVLMYTAHLSVLAACLLVFLIGFTSAAQVLGYPVIAQSNPANVAATAISLAAILVMGFGYGVMLPFTGWLLDLFKGNYHMAFLILPLGILISLFMGGVFKEKQQTCQE